MPSKKVKILCPLCNKEAIRRESDIKNAIIQTGYWACRSCTAVKKNKENSKSIGSKREHMGYIVIKTVKG